MIHFHYKENDGFYTVTLKTSETAPGTLHKMVKAMFFMGWEIVSGDIKTIEEEGQFYSYDIFTLKSDETDSKIKASKLGVLMSSVFTDDFALEEIIHHSSEVDLRNTYHLGPDSKLEFEDIELGTKTKFILEAPDRKGLLYFITGVLKENGINIHSATIRTDRTGNRAQDTFILSDTKRGRGFAGSSLEDRVSRNILEISLNSSWK
ncbi:ACT domain-containing protein [Leptospira mayottensis]|uniref:ACT domain protein n=2 Tax=Leptospira mayottensis TaxID=1137606 RepID=A0AA87SX83_9LEPT|nr:ACT domain-containing protein [Leptospira mayottensis]AXR59876.1 ACT domain-containing protein [Leptospira mayottensis]AXR63873.1 ACT domain-containing protein [Leptospira mayottensis]AXR67424.1 ACT domain-containing protein [Leptospira mayottensis]AZQ00798.1 ACT domain-containing protein [Leptospira mayottensis 200901116]EKR99915.1 ACT domain protein [Leptospira mayottensis 200901122]